jgi:hypothetical protein
VEARRTARTHRGGGRDETRTESQGDFPMSIQPPVLLTVRGTLATSSLDEARSVHNDTAGAPQGIAMARALGDLSHLVFTPVPHPQSSAKAGELMFFDIWQDARGIGEFFSKKEVQGQASRLFTSVEHAVWMPAQGSYSYELPAIRGQDQRFVGMVRGPIDSAERAIEIFAQTDVKAIRDARRRGLLSHRIFIKARMPGDTSPLELLGIDVWSNPAGMGEHYADKAHMAPLERAFSGPPAASIWEQAAGAWSEW